MNKPLDIETKVNDNSLINNWIRDRYKCKEEKGRNRQNSLGLIWEQGAAGSNPATPTRTQRSLTQVNGLFLFLTRAELARVSGRNKKRWAKAWPLCSCDSPLSGSPKAILLSRLDYQGVMMKWSHSRFFIRNQFTSKSGYSATCPMRDDIGCLSHSHVLLSLTNDAKDRS